MTGVILQGDGSRERETMEKIELKAGGYTAWILPERGASCVRLSRFGAEALRTPEDEDSYRQNEFLWGTPILFPPNRISGGCFEFEGRTYRLPVNEGKTGCFLHGTLHRTEFSVVSRGRIEAGVSRGEAVCGAEAGTSRGGAVCGAEAAASHGEAACGAEAAGQRAERVVLRYEATEEKPYLTFPHPFTVTVEWTLDENGLRQKAAFTNRSSQNMPVALAFHTTFRLPFAAGEQPEEVALALDTETEYGRDMRTFLPDGRAWDRYPDKGEMERGEYLPSEHTISRLFRMGARHEMRLIGRKSGISVRYAAGNSYGFWMVYNGGNRDFLCVEPQSWLSNCPNAPFPRERSGFDFIAPGQTRVYETEMSIEK